jgi:hypothetical protein
MYHSEGKKVRPWTLHPFEDVRVWIDAIALDEDGTPLGRGYGPPIHHDVTLGA